MSLTIFAEDNPKLPANLVQVKSGASWEKGEKEGFVRFCAFERGFDHVRHKMLIEWIQVPSSPEGELAVVSRVVVKEIPDIWSIGEAKFSQKDEKYFIRFSATNTYLLDEHVDYSIQLLDVGKVKVTVKKQSEPDVAKQPATVR